MHQCLKPLEFLYGEVLLFLVDIGDIDEHLQLEFHVEHISAN